MTKKFSLFLVLICVGTFLQSCYNKEQKQLSELDFEEFPLKTISDYGFFKGELKALKPNQNVLYYEPIAQLFSDYAFKKRFVWMPAGSAADFDLSKPNEALNFPDKTILIKNFYYPTDFSKPDGEKRILETRLLVKNKGKWNAYPYVWNESQTDAEYKVTGGSIPITWQDENKLTHNINYTLLNKNQCKSCHNQNDKFVPMGLKVKQLNHAITYEDGTTENQLQHWKKMGFLKSVEGLEKIPSLVRYSDTKAPLGERARSYLDVNCGHCHNRQGPASTSGLYLHYEEKDPFHWGVYKSPVAAGMGAGSFKFDVNPKKGNESIITYRMNSIHPAVMMPEIGRVSIHKEGVELITEWINSL